MRVFRLAMLLVATVGFLNSAVAKEQVTVTASEDSKNGVTTHSLYFAGGCGDECLLASMSCNGGDPLEVELIDVPSKEAAKSILHEQSRLILKMPGNKFEMSVASFSFSEMNGSWDARASGQDSDAIYKALPDAKSFTLSLEGRSEALPVTKEVRAWAKACLK